MIFDFDGLILDTETPELQSWESIFNKYQEDFPFDLYKECVGSCNADDLLTDYLFNNTDVSPLLKSEIIEIAHRTTGDQIKKNKVLPGILDFLNYGRENNMSIGLASSSNSEWIDMHVDNLGIRAYFDSILTSDFVKQTKPNPEVYLLSLSNLGINNSEAVVFEDSFNGVSAAKAAQIFTVAIPNIVTKNFSFDDADIVLDSLADFKPKTLFEMIEKKIIKYN